MTAKKHKDDRGAVMMITALSLGFIIIATAFTIDLGRLMLRTRDMQAVADVVALDRARSINGRSVPTIQSDAGWQAELSQSAQRNNSPANKIVYTLGPLDANRQFVQDFG